MNAVTVRCHQMTLAVFAAAITAACTAPSVQDVRAEEPPQCKMGERYICVGKSATRLDTESDTDVEFCRCARPEDIPQMGPSGP